VTKLSFGVTTRLFQFAKKQADGIERRFSLFGLYMGEKVSTWSTTYITHEKNMLATQHEIATGDAEMFHKNLSLYAKYIQALYNDENIEVTCEENKKIIIKYNGQEENTINLATRLNLHCTPEQIANQQKENPDFILEDNKITIGNVGAM
jgi:hypothetical protein